MKSRILEKYPIGLISGFLIGFIIIHPFSMVYEGLFISTIKINLKSFIYSFHFTHLPMALFFGLLGTLLGTINVYYLRSITKNRNRIKFLEGLLPICSYCHKIRDDSGVENSEEHWEKIEDYIYKKTDQEFTHGICPDCVEIAFPQINEKVRA